MWGICHSDKYYVYQRYGALCLQGSHAEKLKSDVLVIDSGKPIKVRGFTEALEIINNE